MISQFGALTFANASIAAGGIDTRVERALAEKALVERARRKRGASGRLSAARRARAAARGIL